jgi:hypothetical protein
MQNAGSAAMVAQPPFSEPVFQQQAESEFVPGDRLDAHAVLSATERSVFLLGGTRDVGPTAEVWRYDLDTAHWQRLLYDSVFPPREVLAATYDSHTRTLIVLDEITEEPGGFSDDHQFGPPAGIKLPKGGPALTKLSVARLVAHDLSKNESTLLHSWKRVGLFDRFGLAMLDRGQFVLLSSRSKGAVTFAMRGVLSANQPITGFTVLKGRLIDRPFPTLRGVIVPVLAQGTHDLIRLESSEFHPHGPSLAEL